jgi:hypothetical protein
MRFSFFALMISLLISNIAFAQGYWGFVPDSCQIEISKSDSCQIEIATFNAIFKENASMIKDNATYYYIAIEDSTDVTLSIVLDAFKDNHPIVKSSKEYEKLNAEDRYKIDVLFFYIYDIKASKRKALVECGYYEGNLSSSINHVLLIKRFGKWRVKKNAIILIS